MTTAKYALVEIKGNCLVRKLFAGLAPARAARSDWDYTMTANGHERRNFAVAVITGPVHPGDAISREKIEEDGGYPLAWPPEYEWDRFLS